jgi:hypothetical protein
MIELDPPHDWVFPPVPADYDGYGISAEYDRYDIFAKYPHDLINDAT